MSEYTPTTGEVRRRYAYARSGKPGHRNQSAVAEFDRWLAAHDAEKRAEWEAEQAIEYGVRLGVDPAFTYPWPTLNEAQGMAAMNPRRDATFFRRRKAGPWVPVTNTESEGKA